MKNINFKQLIPYATAVLLFLGLSLIYFYPVLEGYKLTQGDIEKHKAMGHEIQSHKEKYDESALWTGSMFAGMPTYLITRAKYSGEITRALLELYRGGLPHPAGLIFAYLIGFFILFLCLRINVLLATVGSIAFTFSSYLLIIIEAGHNSKALAIALMAPVLGGFIEAIRGRKMVGVLLIAVFLSLQIHANHLQITYYLILILLFVGLAELWNAIKAKELVPFSKKMALVLVGVIIGILPNIGNLLLTYEYSKESIRGKTELTIDANRNSNQSNASSGLDKDYITQWSYGIDETFTLIVPNAKGGMSVPILGMNEEVERLRKEDPQFFNVLVSEYQNNQNAVLSYFGNQPIVSGPVYIGIVVVLLAFLALLFLRDRFVIALAVVTLLTIMLSWGKNFMGLTEFFIDYIPGYNKFRAVAMILVVAEFTAPILAILFLDHLIKERELILKQKKKLFIGIGAVALVVIGIAISPDSFVELSSASETAKLQQAGTNAGLAFQNQSQIEDYRADIVSDSAWGSLRYLLIGAVLIVLFILGKIKHQVLLIGIGGLILIDLWLVDKVYVNNKKAQNRSASGTKYEKWTKPSNNQIPYSPSAVDQAILNSEIAKNSNLNTSIQNRISNHKAKSGKRVDKRKVFALQYAELMEQTHYRILNTNARLDQDVRTPFFHKSLGGYHGAKMKRFQELVDFYLGQERFQIQQTFAKAGPNYVRQFLPNATIVNMLNAKYIIGPDNTGNSAEVVIENPHAFGNAWFVNTIRVAENPDSAILALRKVNLRSTAIIEKSENSLEKLSYTPSQADQINLTNYSPNKLTYEYNCSSENYAVFSEIYYKYGWKAYINNVEVPHQKVNYTLRGLQVPGGKGTIEFVFEPANHSLGQIFIWISTLVTILLFAFIGYKFFKREPSA